MGLQRGPKAEAVRSGRRRRAAGDGEREGECGEERSLRARLHRRRRAIHRAGPREPFPLGWTLVVRV